MMAASQRPNTFSDQEWRSHWELEGLKPHLENIYSLCFQRQKASLPPK